MQPFRTKKSHNLLTKKFTQPIETKTKNHATSQDKKRYLSGQKNNATPQIGSNRLE